MEFAPQDSTTFSEAILQHANFSRTCLQELNFTRTQLKGAVFDGANLDRADLNQADLECASFHGALLKNARNLNTVKNARQMDIGSSVITNVQASTLQSRGAVGITPGTLGTPFADTQCGAVVADIASPLPKPSDASQYETVIDLVPYADAPTEPHAALQFFSRILEQIPNDIAALEKRSKAYYQLGELDKAIVDLQRVLVLEPDNSRVSCNIGLVYNSKHEPRVALKFLSAALEKGIKDRDLYLVCINNRGISYMLLGKVDAALKEFDRVIVIDPSQTNTYANRARVYASLKQYESAIQDYTRVIKVDPKFIDAYRGRSSAYRAIGRNDLADADERIALDVQNERNH
jgi:tetratricopeptide (TPR) repeat protein